MIEDRIAGWPSGLVRGADGSLVSVFGFGPTEAREILFPVTRERSLPLGYAPGDLAGIAPGVLIRRVVLADLEHLLAAVPRADQRLTIISGYRSYANQTVLFEARVRQRLAQANGDLSIEEARERANGGTALPGHSQHQLGTALDLSTPELGPQIFRGFAQTIAGQWLREHAGSYGFVFPYTEEGRERTRYIAEPWHIRWLGKELAALLVADCYLGSSEVVVDDYLEALERLLG
ncbi:MAG: peptidase [Chloroflexi bacterium]|nr:peptidase [Chloroflexota bacterium]